MQKSLRVTVVDMQPILPAVGGGRQRLLGLYHALGEEIECTYVGSYDWPGEPYRDQQITRSLREILVPLSPEHHASASELSQRLLAGRTVIDMAFADQVHLSPDFLSTAREHIKHADVVVFSHPWCFPALAEALRPDQLLVYDSHNVEAILRTSLHDDLPGAGSLLERVAQMEYALCRRADLVLACSQEDRDLFTTIFETEPTKLRIVPNGAFTGRFSEADAKGRITRRRELGIAADCPLAIFLGSMYGPNLEAARFIAQVLAPRCPEWRFIIVGGAGEALQADGLAYNLILTGRVDDEYRDALLLAADLALNPMMAGSGTNIKMFDYMAAGLPVLTTEIGARGICTASSAPPGIFIKNVDYFPERCAELASELPLRPEFSESVRKVVQTRFSWERISTELGMLLRRESARHLEHETRRPRVALMSTWNIACGIGEHAAYLAESLANSDAEVLILGNKLDSHEPLGFERDLHTAIARVWTWDNRYWSSSEVDLGQISSVLLLCRPDLFILQHHTAYVPFENVISVVMKAAEVGAKIVVEMHNARDVTTEQKEQLCSMGATLLVHSSDEVFGIATPNSGMVRVAPLPIRVPPDIHQSHKRDPANGPIIGGFGFLRPYKGVLIAARVLALLRHKHPNLRYLGWHAMYPGDSSEEYLRLCLKEAERLGVKQSFEINTQFISFGDAITRLRSVDAVLMPYDPSEEGASAAANAALAAARPVVVSPSSIFQSLSNIVQVAEEHTAESYAKAIDRILSDPMRACKMSERAALWASEHSYSRAAEELLSLTSLSLPPARPHDNPRLRNDAAGILHTSVDPR